MQMNTEKVKLLKQNIYSLSARTKMKGKLKMLKKIL